MTLDEFRMIDEAARRARPKLFLLASPDPLATEAALDDLQHAVGVVLPARYREFLQEFGGGSFGLATLFSADPESEWYLAAKLTEAQEYLPENVIPFADDSAGGLYVLEVADGRAMEPVHYWNHDGGLVPTEFADVLEFIARYAYSPA